MTYNVCFAAPKPNVCRFDSDKVRVRHKRGVDQRSSIVDKIQPDERRTEDDSLEINQSVPRVKTIILSYWTYHHWSREPCRTYGAE